MTIEARKISFVKDFLRLEDEDIIKELESTLKQKKAAQFSKEVSAMSMDQFQKEIDTALEDSKAGRSISTTSLKEEIKEWG